MKRKTFLGIFLVLISLVGLLFWRANFLQKEKGKQVSIDFVQNFPETKVVQGETSSQDYGKVQNQDNEGGDLNKNQTESENNKPDQTQQAKQIKVPFTSQAPLGNWNDERLQNGCEEASVAMAMRWVQVKPFSSPSDAQQEIINISKFEEKNFGNFIDASAEDVGKIFSQFYGFQDFTIKRNFSLADLKSELANGNIVLVPAYGRALKNPNYTLPGPITHMLVLVGYDAKTREFITNDPGTRKGEGYRYNENILFDAAWAYPSSKNHPEPPKSTEQKAMLIVRHS